jgi:hypothetical protein
MKKQRCATWSSGAALEHSADSGDGTLEGYLLDLADNHKALFVPLLGRLLPLQINARTQQTTKIVYRTVEEVRAALIARGLAAERVDLLLLGKPPAFLQLSLNEHGRGVEMAPRCRLSDTARSALSEFHGGI